MLVLGVLSPLTGRESRKEKRIPQGKMPEPIKTSGQKNSYLCTLWQFFWFFNCGVLDFIRIGCRCDFLPKVWVAKECLALKVSYWSKLCSTVIESCPLVRSWSKKLWRRDFISRVIHHYSLSTPPLNSKTRKISHTYSLVNNFPRFQGLVFSEEEAMDGCTDIFFIYLSRVYHAAKPNMYIWSNYNN